MNKIKILVVDDESRMRKLVKDFLLKQNYEVLEAGDGRAALDIFFDQQDIALIILDVMMPKMDGWQVCKEIRNYSKVPIIMLTAKSDEQDELLGFQLGVDEYITKPFSPKILVARVEAILRRTNQVCDVESLEYGGIEIDKTAHVVMLDGETVDLSYKEFELLAYFVEKTRKVSLAVIGHMAANLAAILRAETGSLDFAYEPTMTGIGFTVMMASIGLMSVAYFQKAHAS